MAYDLKHLWGMPCALVQGKDSTVRPSRQLVFILSRPIIMCRKFAGLDFWQIPDRLHNRYCISQGMSPAEKREIIGKVHALSIAMTDGRSVTTMRVLGKTNAHPALGTNQNQPFSFLRHSKVGRIEKTPFTLISNGGETFFHLLNRLAIVVSG